MAGIEVEGPGGVTIEFPEGTSAEIINGVMAQQFGGASAGPHTTGSLAALEGALDTASFGFRDEVKGLSEASGLPHALGGFRAPIGAARVGYEYLTGHPGTATETYHRETEAARKVQREAQEEHPNAFLAGQVGGALVSPGFGAGTGATLAARAGRAALAGAAGGALYGVGSGEGAEERAIGGLVGADTGALLGGAGAPIAEGVGLAAGKGLEKARSILQTTNAALRPSAVEGAAASRIARALERDAGSGEGFAADPAAAAAADQAGLQRGVVDYGGETTRALARSAANTSPEARQALGDFAQDRFSAQSQRGAQFIRDMVGGTDATTLQERLEKTARAQNGPLYKRAYAAGAGPVVPPELQRLAESPGMADAMRVAATMGKDRAIAEGTTFNAGVPNLQFWDNTYRGLRDRADAAFRAGENNRGSALKSLSNQLRDELDNLVPEYAQARSTAAMHFGAQNALEAGQKFVAAKGQNADYARVIATMSPPEKELFRSGFASELADRLLEAKDNQNMINHAFVNSEAGRNRIRMALGDDKANQLEAFIRAETIADKLRGALGNSTTARQLAEMGLAAGAGGLLGEGVTNGDVGSIMWAGLLYGGGKLGKHYITVADQQIAKRIGSMLASNDPKVIHDAVRRIARQPKLMDALRTGGDMLHRIIPQGGTSRAITRQVQPYATQIMGGRSLHDAILEQESGNNDRVSDSHAGAIGPGQIMPSTFSQYARPGEDIRNPATNREVSRRIVDDHMARWNDTARAAVAYYSGPANVAPPGSPTPWQRDIQPRGGPSVSHYTRQVLARMKGSNDATS